MSIDFIDICRSDPTTIRDADRSPGAIIAHLVN
jgi:hypothetical protein